MSGPGDVRLALPRPGPAVKGILALLAVLGIGGALLLKSESGAALLGRLVFQPELAVPQVWRFVTSGFVTSPQNYQHLLFTMLGFYFLSPELERRWGSWRFARFVLYAIVAGNLLALAVWMGSGGGPSAPLFGASAALAAIAVAWAREYPDAQIRLFFFLPVSGRALLWVTVGFAVLDLIYPRSMPDGTGAPFAGIAVGLLFAGTPSLVRGVWLRVRLFFLRRQAGRAGGSSLPDLRPGTPTRRGRTGGPPLRVVYGGLEEELKKRKPPKDKRYLN